LSVRGGVPKSEGGQLGVRGGATKGEEVTFADAAAQL